jgi:hypothetical protein
VPQNPEIPIIAEFKTHVFYLRGHFEIIQSSSWKPDRREKKVGWRTIEKEFNQRVDRASDKNRLYTKLYPKITVH